MLKIMTPGPTQVRRNVRAARAQKSTNPDLDMDFFEFYSETCDILADIIHTENRTLILAGEGILSLEAACASLTEKGDRVLILDNGVYGKGFADFVTLYGGEPVLHTSDYERPIDTEELRKFLESDSDFKYATVVGCDTPSGISNPVQEICPLLKEFGILTVVDCVSEMFVKELFVDEGCMDIVCGASQKALSAPPGISFVTVSEDAMNSMRNRKTPIAAFYANLLIYANYREEGGFTYTMPASCIQGIRVALENFVSDEEETYARHRKIGHATRETVKAAGLELFLKDGFSDAVTVVSMPEGIKCDDLIAKIREDYNILIAGSFDSMEGKVIRIGHMGENANRKDVKKTLKALEGSLRKLGFEPKCDMAERFDKFMKAD